MRTLAFSLFHFYQTAHSSNTTKHHNQKNSGNVQHKISLYADDILLYLQHPQVSLQEMFNIISRFSLISHYTINWNKSILLPLSDVVWDSGVQDTFFHHLHTGNIKYSDSPQVVRAFHPQLYSTQWSKDPFTLTKRIAAVKIKTLPQINDLLPFFYDSYHSYR